MEALSKRFGETSFSTCQTLTKAAQKLSTADKSVSLEKLLACRLIRFDKNPGSRPIGVIEVLRTIIDKAIVTVVSSDIYSLQFVRYRCVQGIKQATKRSSNSC